MESIPKKHFKQLNFQGINKTLPRDSIMEASNDNWILELCPRKQLPTSKPSAAPAGGPTDCPGREAAGVGGQADGPYVVCELDWRTQFHKGNIIAEGLRVVVGVADDGFNTSWHLVRVGAWTGCVLSFSAQVHSPGKVYWVADANAMQIPSVRGLEFQLQTRHILQHWFVLRTDLGNSAPNGILIVQWN